MGDYGAGHLQVSHASQPFPRFGSPPLSRKMASSVQKGVVAENMNPGTEGPLPDGQCFFQAQDMFEKKTSAINLATSARDLSTLTASLGGNDDIPIEILSLIDR